MSEQQEQLSAEELKLLCEGRSIDWYLQRLVSLVNNNSGLQYGLTLHLEGVIVSGLLISGKKYFETFAQEFADNFPGTDESKESIRQSLASNASIYDKSETEGEAPPPQFIHLLNARSFAPGNNPLPTNRGVLWRGKINAVSGFSLGMLSTDQT
jgi:hypothetical protein